MKIAIPITDTHEFSAHYGAASALACFEVDAATRTVRVESVLMPSGGTPCSWPDRLHDEGVTVLLVGGMGGGARARCEALGMRVVAGMPVATPAELAAAFLDGTLQPGPDACGHGDHGHDHGGHGHDHDHDHNDGADHAGHCGCAH